jgi:hypothetical protein
MWEEMWEAEAQLWEAQLMGQKTPDSSRLIPLMLAYMGC